MLGVHLHVPVFTLLLSNSYWCYYSVWLKLFRNGDVWKNITGMRNPGTSTLCRVYDSVFGSRSTLQPCRKTLQILDLLGCWCISERCSALFVEFGDSFQWHFADATLLVYMGIPKENWCMTLDVNLSSACVIVFILLHDLWPPGGFVAWVHICKRQASTWRMLRGCLKDFWRWVLEIPPDFLASALSLRCHLHILPQIQSYIHVFWVHSFYKRQERLASSLQITTSEAARKPEPIG